MPLRSVEGWFVSDCTRRLPSSDNHREVLVSVQREQRLGAVRRHGGRGGAGRQPLGRAGAVGELPEQSRLAPALREEDQATTIRRPGWSKVGRGIERQLAQGLARQIPHPDIVLLIRNRHRHPRPVRRDARMKVGARRRAQDSSRP